MTSTDTSSPPIACSLSAAGYRERIAGMGDLAARALTGRTDLSEGDGQLLTFAAQPGVADELRAFIAAEAACCSFLAFDLAEAAGALTLAVRGPQDAQPLIRELFAG